MTDRWWLACQAAVVTAVIVGVPLFGVLTGWPLERPTVPSLAAGGLLIVAGAVVALAAVRALGPSFDPRPTPVAGGALVTGGPFARVRHPIYGAVLLAIAGYGLTWPTPHGLALLIAATVFFSAKARHEEELLRRAYPEYRGYAARVRRRLIPGIL